MLVIFVEFTALNNAVKEDSIKSNRSVKSQTVPRCRRGRDTNKQELVAE